MIKKVNHALARYQDFAKEVERKSKICLHLTNSEAPSRWAIFVIFRQKNGHFILQPFGCYFARL